MESSGWSLVVSYTMEKSSVNMPVGHANSFEEQAPMIARPSADRCPIVRASLTQTANALSSVRSTALILRRIQPIRPNDSTMAQIRVPWVLPKRLPQALFHPLQTARTLADALSHRPARFHQALTAKPCRLRFPRARNLAVSPPCPRRAEADRVKVTLKPRTGMLDRRLWRRHLHHW